jgi:hypothetical protein
VPAAEAAAAGAGQAAVGPGALREDVFKAFLEQQVSSVRQDVRNLHLEVLQQFHQAQVNARGAAQHAGLLGCDARGRAHRRGHPPPLLWPASNTITPKSCVPHAHACHDKKKNTANHPGLHTRQMDLMSVVEGLAQRQEAILTRLDALAEQVADLADAQGAPQAGIAMAWL